MTFVDATFNGYCTRCRSMAQKTVEMLPKIKNKKNYIKTL
jgi:hypothetical protein